ncbi:hypothetical protein [Streptomyces roseolus]|uniref:hypothetical protein n=1 Tax=Streptomyces roseolus TaxID=67358 RepID=UPI00369FE591
MVIMRPAIPSETVKLDPIDVRRPIGRISVVTMEKIPSMTEMTASQETKGEWSGNAGDWAEGVIAVDMDPVLSWHRIETSTSSPAGTSTVFWQIPDVNNRPHEMWRASSFQLHAELVR